MDGRTARAARNRQAVLDAVLALTEEGDLQPTARAVAERAGVATRSVFHHFTDLESMYADAAQTQMERHWLPLLRPVIGDPGHRIEMVAKPLEAARHDFLTATGAILLPVDANAGTDGIQAAIVLRAGEDL